MTRFAWVLFLAAAIAASFASAAVSADEDDVLKLRGSHSPAWVGAGVERVDAQTSIQVVRHVQNYGFDTYDLNVSLSTWVENTFSSDVTYFLLMPTVRTSPGWTLRIEDSVACMQPPENITPGVERLAFLVVADASDPTPTWSFNFQESCDSTPEAGIQ